MKKERMLRMWKGYSGTYYLEYPNRTSIANFCEQMFVRLCPSLEINNEDKPQKLKLTVLKNGIKLEKVGKPIKG